MDPFFSDKRNWSVAEVAALLVRDTALTSLGPQEAVEVVSRMRPRRVRAGTVLLHEGQSDTEFMLFVLQGEALVETGGSRHSDSTLLKLVREGDMLGEQAVVDSHTRSATVTATTDMALAVLDQDTLAALVRERPAVACSLLGAMFTSTSLRLREANRRLHMLTQINKGLHAELETWRTDNGTAASA